METRSAGTGVYDNSCCVSGNVTGVESAHLIPSHEYQWFTRNAMGRFNANSVLETANLLGDDTNIIRLRSDIHKSFDDRNMSFFPKKKDTLVVHIHGQAPDLRVVYHNCQVRDVFGGAAAFLFVRLAWTILPSVAGFITSSTKGRLAVQWSSASETWIEKWVSQKDLAASSAASRSHSPTKRLRIEMERERNDQNDDFVERGRKRRRTGSFGGEMSSQKIKFRGDSSISNTAYTPSMTGDGSDDWHSADRDSLSDGGESSSPGHTLKQQGDAFDDKVDEHTFPHSTIISATDIEAAPT